MTIQQLRCFITMAEELHYTRAAARLHISQPSLSYSISELEKEFSLALFERKDNHTELTVYGRELYPYAVEAIRRIDDISMKAFEMADPSSGDVRFGTIYSISFDLVPSIVERFYADTGNSRIKVSVSQDLAGVLEAQTIREDMDLFLSGKPDEKDFECAYLMMQELKLVSPPEHPLAGKKDLTIDDVRSESIITLGNESHIRHHIENVCRSKGFEPNIVMSVAECTALGAYIGSGMGIGLAPIVPSMNNSRVAVTPFSEPDRTLLGRPIYLCWARNKYMSPAAKRFRDFIIDEFKVSSF